MHIYIRYIGTLERFTISSQISIGKKKTSHVIVSAKDLEMLWNWNWFFLKSKYGLDCIIENSKNNLVRGKWLCNLSSLVISCKCLQGKNGYPTSSENKKYYSLFHCKVQRCQYMWPQLYIFCTRHYWRCFLFLLMQFIMNS